VATISSGHQSIDPHYILGGYAFLLIQLWICSVFYGDHIFASPDYPSIGMPALVLEHVMIFVGCLCAASVRFFVSIPLLESIQIISVISSHILTSYFGGQSVTHQHYSL
jgi:hypothetical protein